MMGVTGIKPDIIAKRKLLHAGPRPESLRKSPALWSEMHVPVEVKKTSGTGRQAMRQLIAYIREMFRDQPDRRFVIGLTISRLQFISVWALDRTGGVGTDLIDMHKACFVHLLL
jgi:hypothetical protein